MLDLSRGQLLLYGGIGLIAVAVATAVVCIVIFVVNGKKIRRKLKQDYGELER